MEDVNPEVLRKQLMVNQFCNQVGCSPDQATKILQAARWQLEVTKLFGIDRTFGGVGLAYVLAHYSCVLFISFSQYPGRV